MFKEKYVYRTLNNNIIDTGREYDNKKTLGYSTIRIIFLRFGKDTQVTL